MKSFVIVTTFLFEPNNRNPLSRHKQGHNEERQGGTIPQVPNRYGAAKWLQGCWKVPTMCYRYVCL